MMNAPRDWFDLAYLRDGTPRQRAAYAAIAALDLSARLAPYTPLLAGTIPLDLDLPDSDLDLICAAADLPAFLDVVRAAHGWCDGFDARLKRVNGEPSAVVRFRSDGFPFEVFAQARPVTEQRAYRHLLVEARVLAEGAAARAAIRALRAAGLKTEPAFARYLCLTGDPYAALLAWGEHPR